jgi:hypothetical protein
MLVTTDMIRYMKLKGASYYWYGKIHEA